MATLFISDLHLEDSHPAPTACWLDFLSGPARTADAVYILGDLFEYWIGDDALSDTAQQVSRATSALSSTGVPCFFLHGNRDFLLGHDYASAAGLELLSDAPVVDLYGAPTLLLHGDTLCTDDTDYQNFRKLVRSEQWQQDFLC